MLYVKILVGNILLQFSKFLEKQFRQDDGKLKQNVSDNYNDKNK